MNEYITILSAWMGAHETLLWWLGFCSVLMFIGTLLAVPYLIARIPADYFMREHNLTTHLQATHPLLHLLGSLSKNFFGLLLIIAGIAMLVLPGQGVLTILIGLMLMNFPGKQALELRIVRQPAVLRAINWIRSKTQCPPLRLPEQ